MSYYRNLLAMPTVNPIQEKAVLMELYTSTDGDNWTDNSGWGTGEPSNSWYGIEVDGNGRVTKLDLYDNNLNGTLPASIGNLDKVEYLNVKKNLLTGSIPSEIGSISALKILILQGRTYDIGGNIKEPGSNWDYAYHPGKYDSSTNDFADPIPTSIGNLSNLEVLEIACAQNITSIPSEIGNLTNLKGLYLSFNGGSDVQIPSSFSNLTNLRHLYIDSVDLKGSIPDLSGCTELRYLTLTSPSPQNTGLTGTIPDLSGFTELRSVSFDYNSLTGDYPSYFNNGNFTNLHTVRLTFNALTGNIHGFDNLQALQSYDIYGNSVSGDIDVLTDVPAGIQILSIGENNISGDFPETGWPDFNNCKVIYFNDNNLTGSIPCSFWTQLDNPVLNIAYFYGNGFTDVCPSGADAMTGNGSINLEY